MDDSDDLPLNQIEDDASETGHSLKAGLTGSHRPRRRLATVYDAVAGRVWHDQLRKDEGQDRARSPPAAPKVIKHLTRETPFAPEEVLFRRKDAPERYAEHDIYHAHERDLPQAGQNVLPDSDLLKAIHSYTSKFYGVLERDQRYLDGRNVDERSMDETALLAFGILLEEAGREVLGRRGDLVFTEGAPGSPRSSSEEPVPSAAQAGDHSDERSTGRSSKRRRLIKSEASSTL